MKDSIKYKFLSTVVLMFLALFSLSFGFFVATSRTQDNVAYWVFKIIAVAWLVIECGVIWLKNAKFSKMFPLTVAGLIVQLIPPFMRIGWHGENRHVPIAIIYIFAFVLFVIISVSLLYSISHSRFSKAEDRAKPSSNH